MFKARPIIGLFGGTFDPIHNGHLTPVSAAAHQLNLKKVTLIPCHIPPHKAAPGVDAKDRLLMTKAAVSDLPLFDVDDIEIAIDKPSYTYDTLSEYRKRFPDTLLCFFIGMDSLINFHLWYRWEDILSLCHLVVCARPGVALDTAALDEKIRSKFTSSLQSLYEESAGQIWIAETPLVDVSSTYLREQISHGHTDNLPIPDAVIKFIKDHGLYQSPSDKL